MKLVPVEEDTTGTERGEDGSVILRDEMMLWDTVYACSPRLYKCLHDGLWLACAAFHISCWFAMPALPLAVLKFTNTTDILFGPRGANSSFAAASTISISNATSDDNGPPWWVGWVVGKREWARGVHVEQWRWSYQNYSSIHWYLPVSIFSLYHVHFSLYIFISNSVSLYLSIFLSDHSCSLHQVGGVG